MPAVQIRVSPDDLHRELKTRAANEGRSLSDFALAQLRQAVAHPPWQDVLRRIASRSSVKLSEPAAELLRAERDAR
ncbi:MAG: hypothetical protein GX471_10000 [Candidatus Microthrix parvicella]|jgi:plasmid stability protein|uniref:FitA-like ribbon-helix-helix domain-containing protein n=1 Tax=Candidatus Neomicrothrix sp. TaxID=2719034 RepID=UPI000E8F4C09|nr:hypothetical protein [Candidatus Microthrix sp.]NLH66490.1 hypothetical protein [Candidatus Microthrix parvicella]MBK6500822.1 hypothetical protein [Candidatus Microthrix sp.]MBK7322206.1 hypothetical protein [Candidatus Microthrix sp.]MBL0203628.1 hypothetical protein [Candidatus Microthrix sp.]HBX08275.1 hypothetical protein [Candidatus Microthrix parvicella]